MATITSFGYWVRRQRLALDLTQVALAKQVDCAAITIRKIEQDERRPSPEMAELLAQHLAIPEAERQDFLDMGRGRYVDEIETPSTFVATQFPNDQIPHNLPAQTTTFIGRMGELAAVREHLTRPEVRLLTLTGPGGTGKTRLSLQVAVGMLGLFADGAFFVDLAPLTDPVLVAFTIAETLGIRPTGNQPVMERLQENLRDKQMLLVLDNFERLLPAAPVVTELLAVAPRLKVVVTSRSLLRLSGEWDYPVPPLELPEMSSSLKPEEILANEAVGLFCERAKAVRPGFALASENATTVAEICVTLDGLPLAIELAAARIRLLPPHIILAQLSHRLRFLTGGPRDLPTRQQTLRDTIDWSYKLLAADEQTLFQRLSVFAGGFTFDAAAAVGNISSEMDTLNRLESLIDKNLLKQNEVEGEVRLDMLETIREYALERLGGGDQANKVRNAHARYYLTLAEEAEPHMYGADQLAWVKRLETEHDNMRSALHWSIETAAELGLRIGGALGRFWHMHAHHSEGRRWLTRALAAEEAHHVENRRYRAKALNQVGMLSLFLGDMIRARSAGVESVSLWRKVNDKGGLADALCDLGAAISRQGNSERARALLEESIDLFHQIEDEKSLVRATFWYGLAFYNQGEYRKAALNLEECRLLGHKVGDIANIAAATGLLGSIADRQGDYRRARSLSEEALELLRQVEDKPGTAFNLGILGGLAYFQDSYKEARQHFEESLLVWQELGNKREVSWMLYLLGNIALRQDDPRQATGLFERGLRTNAASEWKLGLAYAVAGLAAAAQAQMKPERAARLLGISEGLQKSDDADLQISNPNLWRSIAILQADYERTKTVVQAALGDEAFQKAYAEGQAMSPDQALAYALDQ